MPSDCKARLDEMETHFFDDGENLYSDCMEPGDAAALAEYVSLTHELLTERDNLRAELIERCETMERMAREPLWLTVSSGNPMIHFVSDPQWIWSGITTNDEKPQEG